MGGERRVKGGTGGPGSRVKFICDVNDAFSRQNVRDTAARLGDLINTGDALDYCEALGFFDDMHGGDFAGYRRELPIPELNLAMVTAAFRLALTAKPEPVPFQLVIASGTHEIVTVTCTDTGVTCVLIRDDRRRSSRKRAPRAT